MISLLLIKTNAKERDVMSTKHVTVTAIAMCMFGFLSAIPAYAQTEVPPEN